MMKSKLEIYALSVCFSAVVCLVISAGIFGYSVFEILAPELTMNSYIYNNFQTNDAFLKNKNELCSKEDKAAVKPDEATVTMQREEGFAVAIKEEKREGLQSLIRCFMFLFVAGIALVTHWKIAKTARAS
jgi:hypothetical protein